MSNKFPDDAEIANLRTTLLRAMALERGVLRIWGKMLPERGEMPGTMVFGHPLLRIIYKGSGDGEANRNLRLSLHLYQIFYFTFLIF